MLLKLSVFYSPISKTSANLVQKHKQYCHWLDVLCVAFNKRFLSLSYKKNPSKAPHYFLTSHLQQLIKFYLFFCYNVGPRTVRLVNIFDFHYCKTKGSLSCCNLSHLIVGRARPFTLCKQKLSDFFTKKIFQITKVTFSE